MDSIPIVVKVAASFAPVLRQFRHLASIYQVSADIVGGSRHRGAGWQMVKFFLDKHSGHSPLGSRLASKTGFLDQLFAIRPVTSPEIDRDGRPHSSREIISGPNRVTINLHHFPLFAPVVPLVFID